MNNQILSQIENVKIDSKGRFKYILIKITSGNQNKHVLRGFNWAEYHGFKFY
jgi:hypothetical protein